MYRRFELLLPEALHLKTGQAAAPAFASGATADDDDDDLYS